MVKIATLNTQNRRWIRDLSEAFKMQSARVSPSDLAQFTSLAFALGLAGVRREDKLAKAMVRGLSVREKMAGDEGGSFSAEEAGRYLGVTKQAVLNMYHAGKALGWRTEKQGAIRFPVWQFLENRRLPGLEAVLAKLNQGGILDDWGKVGFFLQTHGLLNHRRPLDLLREQKLDLVQKAAEAYVE